MVGVYSKTDCLASTASQGAKKEKGNLYLIYEQFEK
jgi:hypothetical protein